MLILHSKLPVSQRQSARASYVACPSRRIRSLFPESSWQRTSHGCWRAARMALRKMWCSGMRSSPPLTVIWCGWQTKRGVVVQTQRGVAHRSELLLTIMIEDFCTRLCACSEPFRELFQLYAVLFGAFGACSIADAENVEDLWIHLVRPSDMPTHYASHHLHMLSSHKLHKANQFPCVSFATIVM
jgi:hypothetical protein